jgi:predicted transposase YdaD
MDDISSSLIDRSLKVLFRREPAALCRLVGAAADPDRIRLGDVTVNIPEHRADHLFLLGDDDDPSRWALHLEYQLQPDLRVLGSWHHKNAALNAQLDRPVILTVVYLTKGDRATFPDTLTLTGGGLTNTYSFHTVRLWEHEERIRDGDLPELAPLLVLCEDEPGEETLRRERSLILGLPVERGERAELLAIATMIGTRYFTREVLERLFREEMEMMKTVSFVEEWIQEGEARGEARGARQVLLRLLRRQFGELPPPVLQQIEQADLEECEAMAERVLDAKSLEDLGLPSNGASGSGTG